MQTDANTLLALRNLSARIGRQVVLDDVCLEIGEGECVAVVGGSGAGKSTLLRCLLGLTKPARPFVGKLHFNGVETEFSLRRSIGRPSGVAYVPQNPDHGFDPLKRLVWQWRQCAYTATGKRVFTDSHKELLVELGLREFGPSFPHQWSRGMQQRMLVAMALLGQPRLLILDEPTSALDPVIAAQVLKSVVSYARTHGVAILIVTHDLSLAARYAERTAIMQAGKVIEFGGTDGILSAPKSDYGRQLVEHRNWFRPSRDGRNAALAAE